MTYVKYPALRDRRIFCVVGNDEADCIRQYAETQKEREEVGWIRNVYPPGTYPCVIAGYADQDGWQVVCTAYMEGETLIVDMDAFNVHRRAYVNAYPNEHLASQIEGQTIGVAVVRFHLGSNPKIRSRRVKVGGARKK